MKYLRTLSLLLVCLMVLSMAACAPRAAVAPGEDDIIDIDATATPTGANGLAPVIPVPELTPIPGDTPAGVGDPGVAVPTVTPIIMLPGTTPETQTASPTAPETQSPSTPAPATPAPATQAPSTQAPATQPPETPAPSTNAPAATNGLPYYIYVEKGSFTMTIYEQGDDGAYSKVYKTYRIAHGGNKTPAGVFTLGSTRERWHEFPDGGFVQFATLYQKRLYIHSPLYGAEDNTNMWPKYYDGELGIGKASTGGCLRMVTEAARFIYENCPEGTILEIVNGSPKGTTSDDVPSRNGKRQDPTDVTVKG